LVTIGSVIGVVSSDIGWRRLEFYTKTKDILSIDELS
jgi:hypothetical protein